MASDKGDKAAEGSLTAHEPPREAAHGHPLIENAIDLAAGVLDVDDLVREQVVMHDLDVVIGPDLLERSAEHFLARSGRTWRMTVFIGWSALPASMASQRMPRAFTQSANCRVGPGCLM